HGRHQPCRLHAFDQPGRAVVADAQLALDGGNRGAAAAQHEGDGLVVERIEFRVDRVFGEQVHGVGGGTGEDVGAVVRLAVCLEMGDDAMHVVVGDEG